MRRTFSDWVWTTIPSVTGVVQLAGVPRRPSISTTHRRQDPKASMLSLAHSLGICTSTIMAARITDVPSGTVTSAPSMVRVTGGPWRAGVPMSRSSPGANWGMMKSFIRRPPSGWRNRLEIASART